MEITINRKKYKVETTEFPKFFIQEYCNLHLLQEVGHLERMFGFLRDVLPVIGEKKELVIINSSHGGFLPIQLSAFYSKIWLIHSQNLNLHASNIKDNVKNHNIQNIYFEKNLNFNMIPQNIGCICFETSLDLNLNYQVFLEKFRLPVLILKCEDEDEDSLFDDSYLRFSFTNATETKYFIPKELYPAFHKEFHFYLEKEYILNYDNLIHLVIMVKNGGDQFEKMLLDNMPYIDRWTIMDTGSTDNTIDIINRVLVGKKKGELIHMPFKNFRDNRNALLDAAGEWCKFSLMLDDTYVVTGDLRHFLNEVRGDQFSDSFSIFIKSDDMEYGSNRVLKTYRKLRYLYKIHEVIDPKYNKNVIIPLEKSYLMDGRFDYMEKRTMDRKQLDLQLLYEELEEDPDNPRTHYYLGQTYNLIGDYENAFKWFKARVEHNNTGFIQEKVDAAFEMSRIANFRLNKPWEECLGYYNRCFELDRTRPESMYFIGMNHYLKDEMETAFSYLKKAFEIGYPIHCQYSLKPTLSFYYCPKFLASLSYQFKEYEMGLKASTLFLKHNPESAEGYSEVYSWHKIYEVLNKPVNVPKKPKLSEKPLIVFVADGNWKPWNGKTLYNEGLGGSETFVAEMARNIQKTGHFQVFVFCKCSKEGRYEGVEYRCIEFLNEFVYTNYIHSVIVNRYTEYVPLCYDGWVDNVYFVSHDLSPSLSLFPIDYAKLRKIFCLTEWHVEYLNTYLPLVKDFTAPFYYGVDKSTFETKKTKVPFKFIYSSFPNRGLLPLLQMWPRIRRIQPLASLHLYCDLDHEWTNTTFPDMMTQIKKLLNEMPNENIFYYGWTDKQKLAEGWKTADIWFYPCIFAETFCLTALEAAISKTFVVTNHLAALQNTVGNRGLVIPGDPSTIEWQNEAIRKLEPFLSVDFWMVEKKKEFIQKNYEWANKLSWENQAHKFLKDYLLKDTLEYKCMFNWTKNIVLGSKKVFQDLIQYINQNCKSNPIEILEIGTWTGTSLITLVKNIPNSVGYGVDSWKNYDESTECRIQISANVEELGIEQSFYKNIQKANLEGRIFGIKSLSTEALMKFIREGKRFDFVFVDGDHSLLGSYTDIILAWEVVKKGGILGIDDVSFHKEQILGSPLQGVLRFVKEKEGEFEILYSGYQLILKKK